MSGPRDFSPKIKDQEWERAGGKCRACGIAIGTKAKEYDHILPFGLGGKSELANCALLCKPCHDDKTAREDVPRIRKADRQRKAHVGATRAKQQIKSAGFPSRPERPNKIDKRPLQDVGPSALARRFMNAE
jgi:5-methylcytosine-specific restriction enzyme A